MLKYLKPWIFTAFIIIFNFSYLNAQVQIKDTLFISFDKKLVGDKILINKINQKGDSIFDKRGNFSYSVLFTTDSLKAKLLNERLVNKKDSSSSIYRNVGRTKIYGLEFKHFNLDVETIKKNLISYDRIEAKLKAFDSLVEDKEKVNVLRKEFHHYTYLPLKTFFVDDNFLKQKNILNYTGTLESYIDLKQAVSLSQHIFLILDNCSVLGYDYQIIEVKWIKLIGGL